MFGKRSNHNALEPRPIAQNDPGPVEILRVWAVPGSPQQLTLRITWQDAGAGGYFWLMWRVMPHKPMPTRGKPPTLSLRLREIANAKAIIPPACAKSCAGR